MESGLPMALDLSHPLPYTCMYCGEEQQCKIDKKCIIQPIMSTTLMKISTTKKHMCCTWLFIGTCLPFYQNTRAPAKHKMQVDSWTLRKSWNLSCNPIPKHTLPATILVHIFDAKL